MNAGTPFARHDLERIRHQPRERLLAADLDDQVAVDDQVRWWHNRAIHAAFGVAEGLDVGSPTTAGKTGCVVPRPAAAPECSVTVCPGLAYDCHGREIIQPCATEVVIDTEKLEAPDGTVPPGATITLVARYVSPRPTRPAPHLAGVCPAGSGACEGTAVVGWETAPTLGVDVPLARFIVVNGSLQRDPVFSAPRARPMARPYIASGTTLEGNTPWSLWTMKGTQVNLGYETTVDTRAAGFTREPYYFAWLQGAFDPALNIRFFPVMYSHVHDPSPDSFTLRLWMPPHQLGADVQANAAIEAQFTGYAQRQGLHVCWIGIQTLYPPPPACVPLTDRCGPTR